MSHPTSEADESIPARRASSPLLAAIVRHSYHTPRRPWIGAAASWLAAVVLATAVGTAGTVLTSRDDFPALLSALPVDLGVAPLDPVLPESDDLVDSVAGAELQAVEEQPGALPAADPASTVEQVEVGRGDTLSSLLTDAGASTDDVVNAVDALRPLFNPRDLKAGQPVNLILEPTPDGAGRRLAGFAVQTDADRVVRVERDDQDGFAAREERMPVTRTVARFAGVINDSLFASAAEAGLPPAVIAAVIRAFSYDIDFQRDIRAGDHFEVLVERFADADGATVKWGDFLYARMVTGDSDLPIYRYTPGDDGFADFFNAKGESVRKALLRTPVDGARISSGFGMRRHPILGYSKMHKGVDFAAPTGTPVLAAGDGVVETAGPNGSYGNYVRLRHSSEYKTAYAHLSRFARGMKAGRRVRQGDVIAYVGTTGRSTGAHLHYEILSRGRQVNPAGVKFRSGRTLTGKELNKFRDSVRTVNRMLRDVPVLTAALPDAPPLLAAPQPRLAASE